MKSRKCLSSLLAVLTLLLNAPARTEAQSVPVVVAVVVVVSGGIFVVKYLHICHNAFPPNSKVNLWPNYLAVGTHTLPQLSGVYTKVKNYKIPGSGYYVNNATGAGLWPGPLKSLVTTNNAGLVMTNRAYEWYFTSAPLGGDCCYAGDNCPQDYMTMSAPGESFNCAVAAPYHTSPMTNFDWTKVSGYWPPEPTVCDAGGNPLVESDSIQTEIVSAMVEAVQLSSQSTMRASLGIQLLPTDNQISLSDAIGEYNSTRGLYYLLMTNAPLPMTNMWSYSVNGVGPCGPAFGWACGTSPISFTNSTLRVNISASDSTVYAFCFGQYVTNSPDVYGPPVEVSVTTSKGGTYDLQRAPTPGGPWQTLGTFYFFDAMTGYFVDDEPPVGGGFYRLAMQ